MFKIIFLDCLSIQSEKIKVSTFCVSGSYHKNQVEARLSRRRRRAREEYTFARRDVKGATTAANTSRCLRTYPASRSMRHALCIMRHTPCAMRHAPCAIVNAPYTMRHASCAMRHAPRTMRHEPRAMHPALCVTRREVAVT